MKTPPSFPPRHTGTRETFTEQDVCNYAHHLWVESGMSFEGDPWEEARACLAANLSPAQGVARARVSALDRAVPRQPASPRHENHPRRR